MNKGAMKIEANDQAMLDVRRKFNTSMHLGAFSHEILLWLATAFANTASSFQIKTSLNIDVNSRGHVRRDMHFL